MAKLRGVVLAAGRGVRMGGKGAKVLTEIPGGEQILHYVLAGFRAAGVDDLLVVTGFAGDDVQKRVGEVWGADNVSYAFNARYASWGNFHSVRVALDASPGFDVLICNGDVVLPPSVFRSTVQTPGDLVLAVQRRPQRMLDDEDMRVQIEGHRVLAISKTLKMARSHGEFAGLSLVRRRAAAAYQRIASRLQWEGDTQGYYEDIYAELLPHVDARVAEVPYDGYAEVDTPDDLQAAAQVVSAHPDAWPREPEAV